MINLLVHVRVHDGTLHLEIHGQRHVLPSAYRLDEVPFRRELDSANEPLRHHRILYRHQDQDLIAGFAIFRGSEGLSTSVHAELTNLLPPIPTTPLNPHLFLEPDPGLLPPRPDLFENEHWSGHRFFIPLHIPEAEITVLRHGGVVPRETTNIDVVVLPDEITFLGDKRHAESEALVRQGARVLYESGLREGPHPLPGSEPPSGDGLDH